MATEVAKPVEVFYSYAPEDDTLRLALEKHLGVMRQEGAISEWHADMIGPGMERSKEIEKSLSTARLVLLLISPDYLASDYLYSVEMRRVLERHEAGEIRVVPILLCPVDYKNAPFEKLQVLPRSGKPVSRWSNRDAALAGVAKEIRGVVEQLRSPSLPRTSNSISEREHKILTQPSDAPLLPLPKHFVGRAEDLQWLKERLRMGRVTGITALGGMGGLGKTTLAAVAVRQLHAEGCFCDGIAVVLCQDLIDACEVLRLVLARFDPQGRQPEANNLPRLTDAAHQLLDEKDTLIVLDNVEPELDISYVVTALRATPTTLLLTARQMLPTSVVSAEDRRRLSLLSLDEAMELFVQSFGRQTVKALIPTEKVAVEKIVRALDRHTLAVTLAGAYASDYQRDLQILAEELGDPQQAIELLPDGETPQVVARVFARSFDVLPPDGQKLFSALGAFASVEFSRHAVLALGKALDLAHPEDNLNLLIRRAMVDAFPNDTIPLQSDRERVRLHPLMRAFATGNFTLWKQNECDIAQRAIASYYVRYTDEMPHEALSFDDSNILGALEWVHDHGEDALLVSLCLHMCIFWRDRGRVRESLRYLPWGIEAIEKLSKVTIRREDRLNQADLLLAYGHAQRRIGEINKAENAFKRSLELRREVHDLEGEGIVLGYLGRLAQNRGKLEEAEDYCQKALAIHQMKGNRREEGVDLSSLGQITQTRGQFEQAKYYYEQSLVIRHEMRHRRGEGMDLCFLGMVVRALGQFDEAEKYFQESLAIVREIGERAYEGVILGELGYLAYLGGQLDKAKNYYQDSQKIVSELLDRRTESVLLPRKGTLAETLGDLEDAERLYRDGLTIGRTLEYSPDVADALMALGCFLIKQRSNREEGCLMLLEAEKLYREIGSVLKAREVREKLLQFGCE